MPMQRATTRSKPAAGAAGLRALGVLLVIAVASLVPRRAATAAVDDAYYLGLYVQTLDVCAIPLWEELLDAVAVQADASQVDNPALYLQLQATFPGLDLSWDGAGVAPVGAPALQLVTGLESYVLVELANAGPAPVNVLAFFSDAPGVPGNTTRSNVAVVPPQEIRGYLTPVRVDDPAATLVHLTVKVDGAVHALAVPVAQVAPATVSGVLTDAGTGLPMPGRISALGSDGVLRRGEAYFDEETLSKKPIIQGATGEYFLPFFYTEADGSFTVRVPPGPVQLTAERGFEYGIATQSLTVGAGQSAAADLAPVRIADPAAAGWISGDTHVHWSVITWDEDEDYALLEVAQRAEDVRVVNNLTLRQDNPSTGEFIAPDAFPPGPVAAHSDGVYLVHQGEEFRNDPFYGHLSLLDIGQLVWPISTGDVMGPFALDYPVNHAAALQAQAQGGLVLAAHGVVGSVVPQLALGSIDSLDAADPEDLYRFLDCGLRVPVTGGSDHPARVLGRARCYVQIEGPFTYGAWIEGIRQGRTYATSGPLLELSIDGVGVGGEVHAQAGEVLQIQATATSRRPIGRLQVYSSHQLLAEVVTNELQASIDVSLPIDASRWVVARCSAGSSWKPIEEEDVAHTSAIFVTVDGERLFEPAAADAWKAECLAGGADVYAFGFFASEAQRLEAVQVFDDGAAVYDELKLYPDFSASPRQGPPPLAVQFTDESTNAPTAWAWDFDGDGAVDSTEQHPLHVYTQPGLYTVALETPGAAGDTGDVKVDYVEVTALVADAAALSLSAGGTVGLSLLAGPGHAGGVYLLLGSASGTSPGVPVDALTLPLNPDGYLTYTLLSPAGLLSGSLGLLDPAGSAQATLTVPAGANPTLAGLVLHHAFLVFGGPAGQAQLASNPVALNLIP